MDLTQAAARFAFLPLRLRIVPQQVLRLPAIGKSNTLRGAFGMAFRRLVCIPQCREARLCPLGQTCPYRIIFEPSPPPGADRLSKNQDIPRPFIFRPPLDVTPNVAPNVAPGFTGCGKTRNEGRNRANWGIENHSPHLTDRSWGILTRSLFRDFYKNEFFRSLFSPALSALKGGSTKTTYPPGQAFDFTLILLGKAVDYLPYFILAFREVASEGIGLNRAKCALERVEQIDVSDFGVPDSGFGIRDSGSGDAIRNPESGVPCPEPRVPSPAPALIYTAADQLFRTPTASTLGDYVQSRLAQLAAVANGVRTSLTTNHYPLTTVFLTPTYLKSEGQAVRQPEFHHLFKRVRDRLNALSTSTVPAPLTPTLGDWARRRKRFAPSSATCTGRSAPGVRRKPASAMNSPASPASAFINSQQRF